LIELVPDWWKKSAATTGISLRQYFFHLQRSTNAASASNLYISFQS